MIKLIEVIKDISIYFFKLITLFAFVLISIVDCSSADKADSSDWISADFEVDTKKIVATDSFSIYDVNELYSIQGKVLYENDYIDAEIYNDSFHYIASNFYENTSDESIREILFNTYIDRVKTSRYYSKDFQSYSNNIYEVIKGTHEDSLDYTINIMAFFKDENIDLDKNIETFNDMVYSYKKLSSLINEFSGYKCQIRIFDKNNTLVTIRNGEVFK